MDFSIDRINMEDGKGTRCSVLYIISTSLIRKHETIVPESYGEKIDVVRVVIEPSCVGQI